MRTKMKVNISSKTLNPLVDKDVSRIPKHLTGNHLIMPKHYKIHDIESWTLSMNLIVVQEFVFVINACFLQGL
jgi:hypothetical protein